MYSINSLNQLGNVNTKTQWQLGLDKVSVNEKKFSVLLESTRSTRSTRSTGSTGSTRSTRSSRSSRSIR